jgi:hypothetical protein
MSEREAIAQLARMVEALADAVVTLTLYHDERESHYFEKAESIVNAVGDDAAKLASQLGASDE